MFQGDMWHWCGTMMLLPVPKIGFVFFPGAYRYQQTALAIIQLSGTISDGRETKTAC